MRKTITRTITATSVKSGKITFVKGAPVVSNEKVDVFNGTLTDEKALKEVQKLYGATTVVIEKTEVNDVYEISVEDFMKHAKKVEVPATGALTPEEEKQFAEGELAKAGIKTE